MSSASVVKRKWMNRMVGSVGYLHLRRNFWLTLRHYRYCYSVEHAKIPLFWFTLFLLA